VCGVHKLLNPRAPESFLVVDRAKACRPLIPELFGSSVVRLFWRSLFIEVGEEKSPKSPESRVNMNR
jgi:hypothetical protein